MAKKLTPFEKKFAASRASGLHYFTFKGKLYHTMTVEEVNQLVSQHYAAQAEAKRPRSPCLDVAKNIVYGRGEKEYGHPAKNFAHTARLLNAFFHEKFHTPITPQDVGYMMILVKLSRQENMEKLDNIIDIQGYAETSQRVIDFFKQIGLPSEFRKKNIYG